MTSDLSDVTQALPTFDVLPLSKELRQAIDELGYTHPTPVQREVFEPASRGRDLVVQARTGTGKTASFGMPVVDAMVQRSLAAVQVIILCPTRELALQVHRELDTLGKYRGIRSVAVYGGAPMGRQIEELAAGAQVVVGTPGRVLDHLSRGSLNPKQVRAFILDESDEMLSMGFLPQINEIHGYLPSVHQTLLFSATLPPDIQRHAETRLKDPVFLTLSGDQIGALDIRHLVYLTRGDKLKAFERVLEVENPESAIVFCNTRDETKRVAAALEKLGFAADWLNADLAQNEREKVMAATRENRLRFLVCTDVAARGIDISHLTHVINFDFPESAESYVHRTGRTGRAGRTGTAISLIEPSDIGNLYMLRLTYKIYPIERQIPSAGEVKTRAELDLVELFDDAFARREIHPDDLSLARRLLTHDNAERIIAALLRDHLGARPEAPREATDARRAKTPGPPARPKEPANVQARKARDSFHEVVATNRQKKPEAQPLVSLASEQITSLSDSVMPEPAGNEKPLFEPSPRAKPDDGTEAPRYRPRDRHRDRGETAVRAERIENEKPRMRAPSHEPSPRESERVSRRSSPEKDRVRASDSVESSTARARSRGVKTYRDEHFEFEYSVSEAPASPGVLPAEMSEALDRLPRQDTQLNLSALEACSELFVSVGRRDGAKPSDFEELLEGAGLERNEVVAINVRANHSFVRVLSDAFERAREAINGVTIGGKTVIAEASRSSSRG